MSKIEEIRKRTEWTNPEKEAGPYSRVARQDDPEFRMERRSAIDAIADRLDLLAELDGEWQSERPGPGPWNISIRPEDRHPINGCAEYPWPPVVACEVIVGYDDTLHVQFSPNGEAFPLEQYTGALWQRRAVPGDPFAKGGG